MSELHGKLRQKIPGGPYYYRLSVMNGVRREFSLKTCDFEEACQKAADLDVIWDAPTNEVAVAQLNAIKGFSQQAKNLPFDEVWRRNVPIGFFKYGVFPVKNQSRILKTINSCAVA